MILETSDWIILILTGISAGFIDAVVGGGGLLSIPALLSIGIPPHLTLGTNKLAASFSSLTSAATYFKNRLFSPSLWFHTIIATATGAVFGSLIVLAIDNAWLFKILPIIIIGVALYTLIHPNAIGCKNTAIPETKPKRRHQWLTGLTLGGYDGFAGSGVGAFWTIAVSKLYRLPLLNCCGLARSMTLVSNLTALAIFIWQSKVDFELGFVLGLFMMIGSYIGAQFAIRYGSPFIKPLFITMVLCISVYLAWSAW
ncbi:MAG: sulfite exporter TauE/SafE family protein [Parashewanella sp.]